MIAWLSLGAALMQSPEPPAALARFLQQSIGLDAAQLSAMERGEAVVKVLDTRDRRDVALFGIITADVAREAYVRRVRDFQSSLRTATRARFGIFSNPPTAADVAAVTIAERDVKDMRDCRPGDCVVKLPATDMQRIQRQMNWSAPDVQAQIDAYARRRLIEYVTDYRTRGDSAMATMAVVAAKQIYANHYFEAALDLTGVVDRPGGLYVLVLRRYRFDNMPSGGILNIRGRAVGALRDQLLGDLRRQQTTASGN